MKTKERDRIEDFLEAGFGKSIGGAATARQLGALGQRDRDQWGERSALSRPPEGLSIAKLAVLERLHREGPATATALATYLRIQPQALTRLLAYLERHKLIVRKSDKADRRRSQIRISDAGTRTLADDVHARRVHLAQAIEAALTPVERELLRLAAGLMERVADATEPQRDAGGGDRQSPQVK